MYTTYRVLKHASVQLPNYSNLVRFWRVRRNELSSALIGRITVKKPLTASQLRRLPAELRPLLK
jgi:hypothetical protein